MSTEQNKAVIKRLVREWTIKSPNTVDELHATDCDYFGFPSGIEGVRQFYLSEFDRYSERQYTIENPSADLIAEGDQVVVKLLFHATRATGEKEIKEGINIYRLRDGKITEGRGVWRDKE